MAVDDTATVPEDESVIVDVLANDDDGVDPDTLEVVIGPASGSASVTDGAEIAYTPDDDFLGVDILTYVVADEAGNTGTATLEITVEEVNDLPGNTD